MSVRDEIAKALANPDAEDWSWDGMADAVMPIVERVAREAATATRADMACPTSRDYALVDIDAIVRRVMGDE